MQSAIESAAAQNPFLKKSLGKLSEEIKHRAELIIERQEVVRQLQAFFGPDAHFSYEGGAYITVVVPPKTLEMEDALHKAFGAVSKQFHAYNNDTQPLIKNFIQDANGRRIRVPLGVPLDTACQIDIPYEWAKEFVQLLKPEQNVNITVKFNEISAEDPAKGYHDSAIAVEQVIAQLREEFLRRAKAFDGLSCSLKRTLPGVGWGERVQGTSPGELSP